MNSLSMVLKKDGAQLKRRRDGSNNAMVFIAPRAQNFLSRPNKTAVTHSLSELSPAATYVLAQRHQQQQQQRKQQTKPEQSRPQEQQQSQENDKDKEEKEKEKEKGKEKGKEEKKERDKKGKIEETIKSQSPPSRRRLTLDVSERWEGDIKNATEVQANPSYYNTPTHLPL